jgi:hypothetical protein
MNAAVIQVSIESTNVRSSPSWTIFRSQRYHDMVNEVLQVEPILRSHQIHNMKPADSPNDRQHELRGVDPRNHCTSHIFSGDRLLRGRMVAQVEPTLVARHDVMKSGYRHPFRHVEKFPTISTLECIGGRRSTRAKSNEHANFSYGMNRADDVRPSTGTSSRRVQASVTKKMAFFGDPREFPRPQG